MSEIPFPEVLARFGADPLSLVGQVPGVWLLDKPSGPSSNRMVVLARKKLGLKRIGHAGTLDPLASGLLLLLAGNASRLFNHMQGFMKEYRADFRLGERTDSQDVTGLPLPGWLPARRPPVAREELEAALGRFRGEILQTPPMHSALKKNGVALYKLARQGKEVERSARPVRAARLEIEDFGGVTGTLTMTVSSGFYVRTLIDDVGERLGCGAVMTGLRRTAIGPYRLEAAVGLDELAADREAGASGGG